jgi:hypothetical protein
LREPLVPILARKVARKPPKLGGLRGGNRNLLNVC